MNSEINFKFDLREKPSPWKWIRKFLLICISSIFLLILMTCISIYFFGRWKNAQSSSLLYDDAPDLIAVYTGDRGRIEFGVSYALTHPSSKFLISGVYSKNTLNDLINQNLKRLPKETNIDLLSQVIELDYQARNTLENVLMTLQFSRQEMHLKKIYVISSNYHLMRIWMLFNLLTGENDHIRLYMYGVESQTSVMSTVKLYLLEATKILKIIALSLLGNSEFQQE
jgi:uncharacterized SAM-binding protein YcdF (DUF218 family)